VPALKGKNVRFPNCRENQVNGDHTRTKKLKQQYKVVAKAPFRQVQFASPTTAIYSAGIFFFTSTLHNFLFQSPSLACIFFLFFPHPPSLFSVVRALVAEVKADLS